MSADFSDWKRFFNMAQRRVSDLTPVHDKIGNYLARQTQSNFRSGGGDERWPRLADSTLTADRRRYGTRPLIKTQKLLESMTHIAERMFVDVGSNAVQARAQFFGYKNIPARSPFKWVSGVMDKVGEMYSAFIFGVKE